jgi:hypothetical protein
MRHQAEKFFRITAPLAILCFGADSGWNTVCSAFIWRYSMRIFVTVVLCVFGFSGFVAAEPHQCAEPVAVKLAQLKVTPAQITRTVFVDITDGGCCELLESYGAWIDLKQCHGGVVMILSPQCEIEQTYGRGDCDLANLK